jgi:hypothetical protein
LDLTEVKKTKKMWQVARGGKSPVEKKPSDAGLFYLNGFLTREFDCPPLPATRYEV